MKTYQALFNAGLIFDSSLCINPDCSTIDPFIYGAGPMTKYAKRFYAGNKSHMHYNLSEIGHELGRSIRKQLIKFQRERRKSGVLKCENEPMIVPNYEKPLATFCMLPGNLYYLHVRKPGQEVPMEVALGTTTYVSKAQVFVNLYQHLYFYQW